jgi:hypothetical protein
MAHARPASDAVATPWSFSNDSFALGFAPAAAYGLSSIGLSLDFTVGTALSSGEIDVGTSENGQGMVRVPSEANVTFDLLGQLTQFPIAAVGPSQLVVPGLNFTYGGLSFQLVANFSTVITADSRIVGPGAGGAGNLSWSSAGAHSFAIPLQAEGNATPNATVGSELADLSYAATFSLAAVAPVPLIGNVSLPLVAPVSLPLGHGSETNVTAPYRVTGLPHIVSLQTAPDPAPLGSVITITGVVEGGSGALNIAFAGLPAPCAASNSTIVACTPAAAGTVTFTLTVTDGQGKSDRANGTMTILAPTTSAALGPGAAAPAWAWVALGAAVAVAAIISVVWLRARRRARAPPEPDAPED